MLKFTLLASFMQDVPCFSNPGSICIVQYVDLLQIVLLTDGMDTRPYRLPWPPSSFIFDVSPSRAYSIADENLKGVYPKLPVDLRSIL